jgi:hypothetical protein
VPASRRGWAGRLDYRYVTVISLGQPRHVLIPILYLKGVSTGDFEEALVASLGEDAGGSGAGSRPIRLNSAHREGRPSRLDATDDLGPPQGGSPARASISARQAHMRDEMSVFA